MTTPRVSVCIVTYNHERYIHDCLMTVIAQAQDVPLEILVGDDQSSDQTGEIVRRLVARFPDVIQYFRHESRLGPGGNYQFLIGRARGEYIAHVDGDDYWLPGKLAAQIDVLNSTDEYVAAYTNALCISDSGVLIGFFNNRLADRFDLNSLLARGNFLNHSSLVYRKIFTASILEWPSNFIDYRIHLVLARNGQLAYLNAPYVAYRVNSMGSMLAQQSDHVRKLYWEALREAIAYTNDRRVKVAALASFLTGVVVRARQTERMDYLIQWWETTTKEVRCNRLHLAFMLTVSAMRRWVLAYLGKYSGRISGVPSRIFHRR
jgi:glycosyltransferase involved in cell wall biosynthesis